MRIKKKTQTAIAAEYKIAKSTVTEILKSKDIILASLASGSITPKAKRMRTAKHEDVESALLEWLKKNRNSNIPISGPILIEKAKSIAEGLGIENFACSSGWLWRFQNRHGITSQKICGELNKVNTTHVDNWLETFAEVRKKYSLRNIFNMDESGIFFNLFPDRTLDFRGKKCHGGSKSKERITAVFMCNADGSEKPPIWVIGKFESPRCFKNMDKTRLPCTYSHQKNAWIDAKSFRMWLLKFNERMASQNRHILLTLDNCRAHDVSNLTTSHIEIYFFPFF